MRTSVSLFLIAFIGAASQGCAPVVKIPSSTDQIFSVELLNSNSSLKMDRDGHGWTAVLYNGTAPPDHRVHEGRAQHLVDAALSALLRRQIMPLSSYAESLQRNETRLLIQWKSAKIEMNQLALTMPAANSALAILMKQDFSTYFDRRITTFSEDAIQDFSAAPISDSTRNQKFKQLPCAPFHFERSGIHWQSAGSRTAATPRDPTTIQKWLESFVETTYDRTIATAPKDAVLTKEGSSEKFAQPWCEIRLTGRLNRSESLAVFYINGEFWIRNSTLPSLLLHVPKNYFFKAT